MKRGARTVAWLGLLALGIVGGPGSIACSTDHDSGGGADASEDVSPIDPCDSFTTSGASCGPVSSRVCFPLCATGGCRCVADPEQDGGRWVCVTDKSCFPDGAPVFDEDDAAVATDGGDAGDVGLPL